MKQYGVWESPQQFGMTEEGRSRQNFPSSELGCAVATNTRTTTTSTKTTTKELTQTADIIH